MNILFVGAHLDDFELAAGGSTKIWSDEGHNVYSAILTNSQWMGADGESFRNLKDVDKYCKAASKVLGYTPINLNLCPALQLSYSDDYVVKILDIIQQYEIDTLITIWPQDAHPDHQTTAKIALATTRKVPRVFTAKISWNATEEAFNPKFFVDITKTFKSKQKAIQCYKDEYERTGALWEKQVLAQAQLYGLEVNCDLAEGFEILKYRY
jgi:LmbE family N-acetylglucosaminyl deacetylase